MTRFGRNADKKGIFLTLWRQVAPGLVPGAPEPIPEHKFAREEMGRMWRLDWSFVPEKVAVEIDGGQFLIRRSSKTGRMVAVGQHNSDQDREKRNAAAELGWVILQFTPEMLARDGAGAVEQVIRTLRERRRIMAQRLSELPDGERDDRIYRLTANVFCACGGHAHFAGGHMKVVEDVADFWRAHTSPACHPTGPRQSSAARSRTRRKTP